MAGKSGKRKDNFSTRALESIRIDGTVHWCIIDPMSGCVYRQDPLDIANFLRHLRTKHPEESLRLQLFRNETSAKKSRVVAVAKVLVAIDRVILLKGCIKLVTQHHLPFYCFEWEGFRLILDPLTEALKFGISRHSIKDHVGAAAKKVKDAIAAEMRGKIISIMIDSASKHNRHIVCIQAQYESGGEIVIRTLAALEVKEGQTAKFLKDKMIEVLQKYELDLVQIHTATSDNGANMIAAIKILQKMSQAESDEIGTNEQSDAKDNAFLDSVQQECISHINIVRCAAHTVQLAVGDVIKKNDPNVKRITDFVKETRKVKYTVDFEHKKVTRAPMWGATRWGGKQKMFRSILQNEDFYSSLVVKYKELELSDADWMFMKNYVNAFEPVYQLTKTLQSKHVSLSEFYVQWLKAIDDVKKVDSLFSEPLAVALKERLKKLIESDAVKAAVYLDPRLNYPGSTVLKSGDEKESVQSFIKSLWVRLKSVKEAASPSSAADTTSVPTTPTKTNEPAEQDDMDSFITSMFGGSPSFKSESSSFHKQLRQLEAEPRQSFCYDPWSHWKARKNTHPELYELAMVILAAPSTQVSVERAFSALALVFSDLRTGLSDDTLENILLIKLNGDVFDKVLPHLYNWKTI